MICLKLHLLIMKKRKTMPNQDYFAFKNLIVIGATLCSLWNPTSNSIFQYSMMILNIVEINSAYSDAFHVMSIWKWFITSQQWNSPNYISRHRAMVSWVSDAHVQCVLYNVHHWRQCTLLYWYSGYPYKYYNILSEQRLVTGLRFSVGHSDGGTAGQRELPTRPSELPPPYTKVQNMTLN